MNQATETQIQFTIIGYLQYKGYYVQRMNSGGIRDKRDRLVRMNRAGTPDIMAFKSAPLSFDLQKNYAAPSVHLLFIEVKRPGNKPTALQNAVMAELEEHGARCLVAHSVEELEEAGI